MSILRRRTALALSVAVLSGCAVAGVGSVVVVRRAEGEVADRVACRLPAGAEVADVEVGLGQALAGSDGDEPIDVRVTADGPALEHLMGEGDGPFADRPPSITVSDGVLTAALDHTPVPASVVLVPSVVDGEVRLELQSVQLGRQTVSAGLAADLLGEARSIPVPGLDLPDGVELVSTEVAGDHLDLGLRVTPSASDGAAC